MLSKKNIEYPKNLLNRAKMPSPVRAAIVSAGNSLAIESAYEATNKSFIEPIFIGEKDKIYNETDYSKS